MAYTKSNTTNVSFTGTSQSQTLSGKAKQIIMSTTAACYVSFDSSTVSATNGFYVPADMQYIFDVLYPAQVAVIQKTGAGTLSVMELGDSVGEMAVTYTGTYTGDANLKKTVSGSYTGDSAIVTEHTATFTGDASLKKEITSLTFTGDASLKSVEAASFTGDANLKGEVTGSYTGDASLQGEVATTFTGDSALMTLYTATFTGDASLKSEVTATFTGDANMLETIHPLCFNGDAKLVTF